MRLARDFGSWNVNGTLDSSLMYYSGLSIGSWPSSIWVMLSPEGQITDFQSFAFLLKTANILGIVHVTASCSHTKNEPMSRSKSKNVPISFIQSYDI
jgi:hypothetical protein